MDFQNTDNMLNSLITSSDFSNVSFLLNGNDETFRKMNGTTSSIPSIENVTPTKSLTRNLMDFTFNVKKNNSMPQNATYTAEPESPMKEFGIENADFPINDMSEDFGKNLTYNAHEGNLTWDKIQDHQNQMNQTIVQSTPVTTVDPNRTISIRESFGGEMSPISSFRKANEDGEDDGEVVIRALKARNFANDVTFDDYRNSMEDQCEFLLNEETIKLSSRVCGDTFECLDMKTAFIQSADANERDFDKMLDSFNVKKSLESEKLLQSVDNIKQRHSLINFEKQREEKEEDLDNKTQYDTMNKSSERLLRRSRLYDDVNLQVQKQHIETNNSLNGSDIELSNQNAEPEEEIDRSNRDRFKTIKLNKKLQSGMVVVNDEAEQAKNADNSISPGTNKERRNQLNQLKQEIEDENFKKPAPTASKLSKFGFSRPTYRSRNDLNLPLKASSTDSLDNDEPRTAHVTSNLKSPMGIKSKSIHNLMFNGNNIQNGNRLGSYSNLKLIPGGARSQSNLKTPRASSLVRPTADQAFKVRMFCEFISPKNANLLWF